MPDEEEITAIKLFDTLHDRNYIYHDAYVMFEKAMDLGIKDLYYNEEILGDPFKRFDRKQDKDIDPKKRKLLEI